MNSFFRKIIEFAFFFMFLILPLALILSPYDNADRHYTTNTNIITLQTKSKFDSLDVLFLGNSYCYSAIQPEILDKYNIKSFNLSVAAAGVEFYELIMMDYLKHVEAYPEKIFILLSPMTFSTKSDNYKLYPIHRYLEKPISNIELILMRKQLTYLLPLYKKSISKGVQNILTTKKVSNMTMQPNKRGFVENHNTITQEGITKSEYLYTPLLNDSFDFKKINAIQEFVSSLEKLNINVYFLELPTNLLNNYFNDNYLTAYDQSLKELRKNNLIYSVSDSLFSTENFRNIDHMNASGSIIVSHQISNFLLSLSD